MRSHQPKMTIEERRARHNELQRGYRERDRKLQEAAGKVIRVYKPRQPKTTEPAPVKLKQDKRLTSPKRIPTRVRDERLLTRLHIPELKLNVLYDAMTKTEEQVREKYLEGRGRL